MHDLRLYGDFRGGPRARPGSCQDRPTSAGCRRKVPAVTEPLYQRDAYLASFDAEVAGLHPDGVVLDRSAFFPGGGGQPADTGTIEHQGAELMVTGTARRDGELVLLVEGDLPVHVSFLSPDEFTARPELIRTKTNLLPPGLEVVRVIDIEGLDRQADGGTHVAHTGEIGEVHGGGHESKGKRNKRLRIALEPAGALPGPG